MRWPNLKERLLSVCPSCSVSFYLNQPSSHSTPSPVYLLKYCGLDRKGVLHGRYSYICLRVTTRCWFLIGFIFCSDFVLKHVRRCHSSFVLSRTYNSESKSDYDTRWSYFGPLLHNRQLVSVLFPSTIILF